MLHVSSFSSLDEYLKTRDIDRAPNDSLDEEKKRKKI